MPGRETKDRFSEVAQARSQETGQLVGQSAGLVIERLRVRIPAGAAGEFSSPELTLHTDLFDVRSTPVLLRWHVKDPGHSAKSAGGRLHLYTHTPLVQKSEWADYAAVQAQCGNLSGNELTRNLSENIWPQSPQLAESVWTDPGMQSGISVRELISTKKKEKKKEMTQAGNEWPNIFPLRLSSVKLEQACPGIKAKTFQFIALCVSKNGFWSNGYDLRRSGSFSRQEYRNY